MSASRFAPFTDDELVVLWDELRIDDGLSYSIMEDDQPTYLLASEIYEEAKQRGMVARDEYRWEHTLM